MRLFVAVELPDLAAPPSGPRPPERHLTLRFLGEVDPGRLPILREAVGRATVGGGRFEVLVHGGGSFPGGPRPRVVWAGVTEGREALLRLEGRISAELAAVGFPPEGRPFVPHLTLLRVRGGRDLPTAERLLRELEGFELGRRSIDEVVLFESVLRPTGAEHRPVARFALDRGVPDAASAPSQ